MKIFKSILFIALIAAFVAGCDDDGYIDPITSVDPGPDQAPPSVEISNPTGDIVIPFTDVETSLNFRFQATDDIEVESVSISLNGTELSTFNDFRDFRDVRESFRQEDLPLGEHTFQVTATDISGKSTTETITFEISNRYEPKYEGEVFFMPFEAGVYMEMINEVNATVEGNPGFADGVLKDVEDDKAYAGAEGAYLTFPTSKLDLGSEFSAAFWYNLNADPDRAGILVIGPPDLLKPDNMNNRMSGFRFFRENAGGKQRVKLNVGTGIGDSWFDGGAAADIDPASGWVHLAFTISATEAKVYMNGQVVAQGDFAGVSWADTDILSIMSGAPRFTEWGHLSDRSLMDELRIFNKALSQQEIQQIIADES